MRGAAATIEHVDEQPVWARIPRCRQRDPWRAGLVDDAADQPRLLLIIAALGGGPALFPDLPEVRQCVTIGVRGHDVGGIGPPCIEADAVVRGPPVQRGRLQARRAIRRPLAVPDVVHHVDSFRGLPGGEEQPVPGRRPLLLLPPEEDVGADQLRGVRRDRRLVALEVQVRLDGAVVLDGRVPRSFRHLPVPRRSPFRHHVRAVPAGLRNAPRHVCDACVCLDAEEVQVRCARPDLMDQFRTDAGQHRGREVMGADLMDHLRDVIDRIPDPGIRRPQVQLVADAPDDQRRVVLVLLHLRTKSLQLRGDGFLVVVVEPEIAASITGTLPGHLEPHGHEQPVPVSPVQYLPPRVPTVVGSPRPERIAAVRGEALDIAEFQPGALDGERLIVQVELVAPVDLANLGPCGRLPCGRDPVLRGATGTHGENEHDRANRAGDPAGRTCIVTHGTPTCSGLSRLDRGGGGNQLSLELLEGLSFRLGNDHQHEHQAGGCEEAVDEEGGPDADRGQLPGEDQLHQEADGRVDQADEGDGQAPDTVGEQFREEDPHHRPDGDGEGCDEAEDAEEDQHRVHADGLCEQLRFVEPCHVLPEFPLKGALERDVAGEGLADERLEFLCVLGHDPGRLRPERIRGLVEAEREDEHGDGNPGEADAQQRLSSEPVDQQDRQYGEHEVDQAHENRLDERGVRPDAGLLEDDGRVEEDGVDPRDLLEYADHYADREHEAHGGHEQVAYRTLLQVRVASDARPDLGQLDRRCIASRRQLHDGKSFRFAAFHDEPARALRHEEETDEVEHRRQRLQSEHPPPRVLAEGQGLGPARVRLPQSQDQVVREEGDGDPDDDVQLVERDHAPAHVRRRELGDIHRRDDQRRTHGQAAEHPRCDEQRVGRGQRRSHGGDAIENGRGEENGAPSEPVAERSRDHHPQRRGQRQRAHRPAELERREAELQLDEPDDAGDDGSVETHEEAAKRDDQGRADDEKAIRHGSAHRAT
jgi:hypothetical protein